MDDILKVLSEIVVDIQGFNDTHFGIFNADEREDLKNMWFQDAKRDPNKFVSLLSPSQKQLIAVWATQRCSFSTVRLIESMENFTNFLKTLPSPIYPPQQKKRKSKGWKRIIYKDVLV